MVSDLTSEASADNRLRRSSTYRKSQLERNKGGSDVGKKGRTTAASVIICALHPPVDELNDFPSFGKRIPRGLGSLASFLSDVWYHEGLSLDLYI